MFGAGCSMLFAVAYCWLVLVVACCSLSVECHCFFDLGLLIGLCICLLFVECRWLCVVCCLLLVGCCLLFDDCCLMVVV